MIGGLAPFFSIGHGQVLRFGEPSPMAYGKQVHGMTPTSRIQEPITGEWLAPSINIGEPLASKPEHKNSSMAIEINMAASKAKATQPF
jgi:hypothetical protein